MARTAALPPESSQIGRHAAEPFALAGFKDRRHPALDTPAPFPPAIRRAAIVAPPIFLNSHSPHDASRTSPCHAMHHATGKRHLHGYRLAPFGRSRGLPRSSCTTASQGDVNHCVSVSPPKTFRKTRRPALRDRRAAKGRPTLPGGKSRPARPAASHARPEDRCLHAPNRAGQRESGN